MVGEWEGEGWKHRKSGRAGQIASRPVIQPSAIDCTDQSRSIIVRKHFP